MARTGLIFSRYRRRSRMNCSMGKFHQGDVKPVGMTFNNHYLYHYVPNSNASSDSSKFPHLIIRTYGAFNPLHFPSPRQPGGDGTAVALPFLAESLRQGFILALGADHQTEEHQGNERHRPGAVEQRAARSEERRVGKEC